MLSSCNDGIFCKAGFLAVVEMKSKYHAKNQYGVENEGGHVQSDSKIGEVTQCPMGTHILLESHCGYSRMK